MTEISRRSFLRGSAVVAIGAAAASALSSCSSSDSAKSTETATHSANAHPCSVHEFDVVVVGSGIAGLTAARRALDKGMTVAIIDKGQYGHSGASGINWGHACTSLEYNDT